MMNDKPRNWSVDRVGRRMCNKPWSIDHIEIMDVLACWSGSIRHYDNPPVEWNKLRH